MFPPTPEREKPVARRRSQTIEDVEENKSFSAFGDSVARHKFLLQPVFLP
ncbi:hypothetical protein [Rhizobium sp. BT03]|nr:hypothetical protein [Rhizobium sp. BT03]WHO74800.1 hypothetical protein QMO80_003880 [Rhizobium sp. BT03]